MGPHKVYCEVGRLDHGTGHLKILIALLIMLSVLAVPAEVTAHGGIPGVLEIIPPQEDASETFWMIDTLGLFRGAAEARDVQGVESRAWSWLCDDAVDPTLGVDALLVIDTETLIAVARSGVYRSIDRGCSFERLSSPINENAIGGISAHPYDPSELAIFTNTLGRENRVWWSGDKGERWTPSNLLVEGGIFGLWRDPDVPEEIWVNHAQGLSRSRDGGRSFETLSDVNFSGASPYEVRLLGGGYLNSQLVLWASLDHYPTSSLMISHDEGQNWTEIHRVNDSYDQLALTADALWVSTPFEGLFVYPISEVERENTQGAWEGFWRQYSDTFVSCLTPDPLDPSALWACGRSEPTGWLVGRSTDLGESWSVLMTDYQEAAEGTWGCADDSPSVLACSTRCLAEGCDPSQNMNNLGGEPQSGGEMMNSTSDRGGEPVGGVEVDQERPSIQAAQESGCRSTRSMSLHEFYLLAILVVLGVRTRRIRASHDTR